LGQETRIGWTGVRQAFGLGDVDVAEIVYGVAQLIEAPAEAGYAQGGGAHVYSPAALAQV
jgi:hypothetical protein